MMGSLAYVDTHRGGDRGKADPDLLYHFPAQSGLPWHVKLVKRLLETHGGRIVGLKDSSGDMGYAREAAAHLARTSRYFPRPKRCCWRRAPAHLPAASRRPRTSTPTSARAHGVAAMRARSTPRSTIRKLFDGKQLVAGVKALLAHIHGDAGLGAGAAAAEPVPGRRPGPVVAGYDGVRAKRVA